MEANTPASSEFLPIKYVPLLVPLLGLLQLVGALLILVGALGGCAAIERQQAADTEKLLAAAGFQMRPADSAERQQDLANMPPHRIIARDMSEASMNAASINWDVWGSWDPRWVPTAF